MDFEDMSMAQKTGYGGSLLLVVGNFLPIFCVFGFCVNYMDGEFPTDGFFILVMGLISAYLVNSDNYRGLAATGGISLAILIQGPVDAALDVGFDFIGYGFYVLFAGVALVLYTAYSEW